MIGLLELSLLQFMNMKMSKREYCFNYLEGLRKISQIVEEDDSGIL